MNRHECEHEQFGQLPSLVIMIISNNNNNF